MLFWDVQHLIKNTFDRKRIYANPSSYPNSNTNPNPNLSPNPKAQLCFRTEEMTSFFDQVYRYRFFGNAIKRYAVLCTRILKTVTSKRYCCELVSYDYVVQ